MSQNGLTGATPGIARLRSHRFVTVARAFGPVGVFVARGLCEALAQRLCALDIHLLHPLADSRAWIEGSDGGRGRRFPLHRPKRVPSSAPPIGHKWVYSSAITETRELTRSCPVRPDRSHLP